MNPVFAALAAVAFGLTLIGADASAAPAPSHAPPAHKAGQAAKPAKSSADKAPKASAGKPATPAKAAKAPSVKPSSAKVPSAKAAKAPSRTPEVRKGKSSQPVESVREPREGKAAHKTVKEVRIVKGRKVVVERSVPVTRDEGRKHRAESGEAATPRSGGIGREAFVPSSPPIPRAEAVRQIQSRNALPPIPAPNVPIPPPRSSSLNAPRPSVTLPPPAPEVARAQARGAVPEAAAPLAPAPVEAPRVAQRYAAGSAELSGPEAAAAAAASLNAAQAPDPVPARAVPAPLPAAPAYSAPPAAALPAVTAPAAAVAAPAAVQSQPGGRTPKGTPRAYAMDGATFYQGGRKIRVQGLDIREPGMTSEHATQRLQRALDSGSVSVEPVEVDGSGHTVAVVRVNGRNVAETVRAVAN